MSYCTTADVFSRSGFTVSDIGTAELTGLIALASEELNNQLNIKIFDERVRYLGGWKENTIDGSNKTFYTRNYPLGDRDDDFEIGTADVYCYGINGDNDKIVYSIASVDDDEEGKFTLSSAPQVSVALYLTYECLPIPISDIMIRKACTELSTYYAIKRLHGRGGIKEYKLGALSIKKGDTVGKDFFDEYNRTLNQIRRKKLFMVEGADLMEIPTDGE